MWDENYGYFMAVHHGFPSYRGYGPPIWTPIIAQGIILTKDPKWRKILDHYLSCGIGNLSPKSKESSTFLQFISLWPAMLEEAGVATLPKPFIPEYVKKNRKAGGRRGLAGYGKNVRPIAETIQLKETTKSKDNNPAPVSKEAKK